MTSTEYITRRTTRAFFSLLVAGGLIGWLHPWDSQLALFSLFTTIVLFYQTFKHATSHHHKIVLLSGVLITGICGVMVELWGIHNGYWAYHDLPETRTFARWLPFAWMLSFIFLYRFENHVIAFLGLTTIKSKILLALSVSAILPTWGEIITINLGVWTYYWKYQIVGVPLLAVLLLMIFHTGIFLFFVDGM